MTPATPFAAYYQQAGFSGEILGSLLGGSPAQAKKGVWAPEVESLREKQIQRGSGAYLINRQSKDGISLFRQSKGLLTALKEQSGNQPGTLLRGPYGIGKTALVQSLGHSLMQQDPEGLLLVIEPQNWDRFFVTRRLWSTVELIEHRFRCTSERGGLLHPETFQLLNQPHPNAPDGVLMGEAVDYLPPDELRNLEWSLRTKDGLAIPALGSSPEAGLPEWRKTMGALAFAEPTPAASALLHQDSRILVYWNEVGLLDRSAQREAIPILTSLMDSSARAGGLFPEDIQGAWLRRQAPTARTALLMDYNPSDELNTPLSGMLLSRATNELWPSAPSPELIEQMGWNLLLGSFRNGAGERAVENMDVFLQNPDQYNSKSPLSQLAPEEFNLLNRAMLRIQTQVVQILNDSDYRSDPTRTLQELGEQAARFQSAYGEQPVELNPRLHGQLFSGIERALFSADTGAEKVDAVTEAMKVVTMGKSANPDSTIPQTLFNNNIDIGNESMSVASSLEGIKKGSWSNPTPAYGSAPAARKRRKASSADPTAAIAPIPDTYAPSPLPAPVDTSAARATLFSSIIGRTIDPQEAAQATEVTLRNGWRVAVFAASSQANNQSHYQGRQVPMSDQDVIDVNLQVGKCLEQLEAKGETVAAVPILHPVKKTIDYRTVNISAVKDTVLQGGDWNSFGQALTENSSRNLYYRTSVSADLTAVQGVHAVVIEP